MSSQRLYMLQRQLLRTRDVRIERVSTIGEIEYGILLLYSQMIRERQMTTSPSLKRQNFNVTPDEEAELNRLRESLGVSSVKEAILRATRTMLTLAREIEEGRRLYTADAQGRETRLLLPDIEAAHASRWNYLTQRPHSWKRQLYVKGRRLTAANVWYDMRANGMTVEQAAENWELPVEAVHEIVAYCSTHQDLIGMEADEEKRSLQDADNRMTAETRA